MAYVESDDHQTQKQEYQQEMDSLRERESELSESAVSSKAALAKVSKKLAQFEKNIGHKEKTFNKVTPKLLVTTEKIKHMEKRCKEQSKVEEKISYDLADQYQSVSGLENDIARLMKAEEQSRRQLESSSSSNIHLNKQQLDAYGTLRLEVSVRISKEHSVEILITNEIPNKSN